MTSNCKQTSNQIDYLQRKKTNRALIQSLNLNYLSFFNKLRNVSVTPQFHKNNLIYNKSKKTIIQLLIGVLTKV